MAENSNIDELMGNLQAFVDGFNFRRKGIDQSLGRDVVMTIIRGPSVASMGGIVGRAADGVTPSGEEWPENSDNPAGKGYASKKEKQYGWSEVNRRSGDMLSQQKLYGETRIEETTITMVYGDGTAPTRSVAPTGHLSNQDRKTPDRTKAMHAHAQGRSFYGFNDEDRKNVIGVAQENLDGYIRERNNQNGTG